MGSGGVDDPVDPAHELLAALGTGQLHAILCGVFQGEREVFLSQPGKTRQHGL